MKNNLDKTKPRFTTVVLSEHIILPVPWLSYVILRFHCSWLQGLRNLSLQSIREIDVYSAVLQVD